MADDLAGKIIEMGPPPDWKPMRCLLCEKMHEVATQEADKGADYVCPRCASIFKDTALLRCAKCNTAIGRVVPGTLDTGFVISPRTVLRSDSCAACNPEIVKSTIVEARVWAESRKRK